VPLSPGVCVGRYEIVGLLGAGGMGEVYRARDTRLNRVVALKVLLRGLSGDLLRRERFEREAQAISSLNHPHICTLYDVGSHEGTDYLVMELLEGQTMAERIQRGPLPLDEAIRHGIQIADALEAAHRRGIVHRDLKPANVFLARSGGPSGQPIAKLLDFGIAKAIDPSPAADADQATLTEEGTVLGTLQYMAPEQLEGRAADTRSDLFAFGAVLYEMLTGRRAFVGDSPSKIIAAVLDSEPLPLGEAQPLAPPLLEHVVMTCLAKNPDERWQSAADVRRQLAWIASNARPGAVPAATSGSSAGLRGRRTALVGACIVALGIASLLTWVSWSGQGAVSVPSETRLEIATPATTQPWSIAMSPDGLTIAFVAEWEGQPALWVRPLNDVTARPLRGTSGATDPFWSPDSRSIAFFADGKLRRIDLNGGAPQTLADALQPHGGAWSRNGTIIFAPHQLSPLLRVSADAGTPSAVTQLLPGHTGHMYPRLLPDDDYVLYYVDGRTDVSGAYLGRLDGTPAKKLLFLTEPAEYGPSGHLLFLRDNALFAQALDVPQLELTGSAVRVADRIAIRRGGGDSNLGAMSTSNTGTIIYRAASTESGRQLTWYDRSGKPVARVGDADIARTSRQGTLSLSPDGQRVVVARTVDRNQDLWLLDLRRGGAMTRLTLDPASDGSPLWSRDGLRLTFASTRNGTLNLYQRALGANGDEPLLVTVTPHLKVPVDWSPNGRFLLYLDADPDTHLDIWAMPVGGEKPFPVVRSPYEDLNPQFSPDGKWIAYQSSESSRDEVYLRPFAEPGAPVPVSTKGATQPRWRRDGKELFYLGLDRRLMAVPVAFSSNGRSVDVGIPAALFQTKVGGPGISQRQYEVSSDGQRFLIDVPMEDVPAPIIVIQHWRP
jgi:serine/threonine protein kinase